MTPSPPKRKPGIFLSRSNAHAAPPRKTTPRANGGKAKKRRYLLKTTTFAGSIHQPRRKINPTTNSQNTTQSRFLIAFPSFFFTRSAGRRWHGLMKRRCKGARFKIYSNSFIQERRNLPIGRNWNFLIIL